MSAATTFTTLDGKRQAELISLDGRNTFKVTVTGTTYMAAEGRKRRDPGFITVRTVRQYRTIKGEKREITLLAPITLAELRGAGVSQRDLEAWGLVPPPVKSEVAA